MDHKFSKNRKYYTISIYAVAVIVISAIIIRIIYNWASTFDGFKKILGMVSPFLIGFLIAYMLNPLVKLISEKLLKKVFKVKSYKKRNGIAVLLSYIIVISAITTIVVYVIPQIVQSFKAMTEFVNTAQAGYKSILDFIRNVGEKYPQIDTTKIIDFIEEIPNNIGKMITDTIPNIASTIYSTSISVITGFLNSLIAIMVSIYMLLDKDRLINNGKRFMYAVLKQDKAETVTKTVGECNHIFYSFVVGKLIDSFIIGVLCFIILSISGFPCAVIISVIVGITNMIPYFGPFIGAIPSILLLLFIDFGYALAFSVIIIILQQFDGLYLGPRILGDKTGLRPLWVIFAITVGGYVAGVAGMFLGVPTVAVIAHLIDGFMDRKISKNEVIFYKNEDTGIIYRLKEGEEIPENCVIYIDEDEEDFQGNEDKKKSLIHRIIIKAKNKQAKQDKNDKGTD